MSFDINKFIENKKLKNIFIVVLIAIVTLLGISIIILSIFGNKTRVGYLTDFNLNIDETFDLNNLENIKDDFIIDGKLDEESIKNYLLTNENITNYVYQFRIRYYDKVFRNSDIYGVYVDLSNLPDYIKNAKMEKDGSPYGNFISDRKIIEEEKIDNINYTLKIKSNITIIPILVLLFIISALYIVYIVNKYKIKYNYTIIIALTFIPILIYFIFICVNGIDVPFYDDWRYIIQYDKIKNSNLKILELLSLLFSQHNEHRIFFPGIITIPFLALTKLNVKGLMFLSFFIYLAGYLFIIKYFYKNTIKEDKSKLFLSIFITIILFSLQQEENIIWGFQIAWYMIFTSVVISFYLLDKYFKSKNIKHIIISIIFGIIASFSSAHGLIIWLSIFSLFILSLISREKNYYKTFIAVILFGIVCFIIYFNNYNSLVGGQHTKFFSGNIIKFFLSTISSSILYNKFYYKVNIFSFVFIFLTIYIIIYLIIKKKILENAFPLLMLIYSYGFIFAITISRVQFGIGSRYITFINLLPVSLFILYLNNFSYLRVINKKAAILFHYFFIVLSLTVFTQSIYKLVYLTKYKYKSRNFQSIYNLRNYKRIPIERLRPLYTFKDEDDPIIYIYIYIYMKKISSEFLQMNTII